MGILIANVCLYMLALSTLGRALNSIIITDWAIYQWRIGDGHFSTALCRCIVSITVILCLLCLIGFTIALNMLGFR